MRLAPLPRRQAGESLLPLIDVVFFLVVFFMLTSRLSDPVPFDVIPPKSSLGAETHGAFSIFMATDGTLARVGATGLVKGEAALASLGSELADFCVNTDCRAAPPTLLVHADADAAAVDLARLMSRAAALGFTSMQLMAATS